MLDELPNKINMLPICRPYVLKANTDEGYSYISGIVLIAQSHIAFHYSITEKILFCDLFSCSFYKSDNFINYLIKKFNNVEHMTLIRGSKHELEITDNDIKRFQLSKCMQSVKGVNKDGL
jgi:S-adenosylmethionine decarboxylase